MAAKDPTLNLIDFRKYEHAQYKGHDFRIDSMKNTILHTAGDYIQNAAVQDLINIGWAVNIRQPRNSDFS